MEYKILTRKNYILDSGLMKKDTTDVVIPFSNMEVDVVDTFTLGDKVTLATEEKMEFLVNQGIAGSHKTIAGEFEVANDAEVQTTIATYNGGGDLTLTNGRILNNGNATPGEVLFFIPKTGSTFKAEEYIVGSTKELIALSNENIIDSQFASLETRIKDNESALTLVDTSVQVDGKVAVEKTERENDVQTINGRLTTLEGKNYDGDIIRIDAKDVSQDNRLEALEEAEELTDKVWEGSIVIPSNGAVNLSTITDVDGASFDFTVGKKLEVYIKHTVDNTGVGHNNKIGDTTKITYVIPTGTASDSLGTTLSVSGVLSVTVENGSDALTDFEVYRVIESKAALAVSAGYSKNESDNKFGTIAQINALSQSILGKQDSIDSTLTTTTKSIVGGINEIKAQANNNETDTKELNSGHFDIKGDGTVVVAMFNDNGTLTGSFKSLLGVRTDAEIESLIDAKLSQIMDVTFTDDTTGQFKLGK